MSSKHLKIIVGLILLFGKLSGQIISLPQGSKNINYQIPRGQYKLSFGIPLVADTAHGINGVDSLGLLIEDSSNVIWVRGKASPTKHKWIQVGVSSGSPGVWGSITGTITDQIDLDTLFNRKQNILGFVPIAPGDTALMLSTYLKLAIAQTLFYPLTTNPAGYLTSNGLPAVANALQVINVGGVNSWASGTYAARPSAGQPNRAYIATDSLKIYFDNGSVWLAIAGGSGPGGTAVWGGITGTLSAQTDLANALALDLKKASNLSDVNNPATALGNLGGVPTTRTIQVGAVSQDLSANRVFLSNVKDVDQTVATNLTSGTIPAGRYGTSTIPEAAVVGLVSDLAGKVANALAARKLGYGPYSSRPGSDTTGYFYYVSDSARWSYYTGSGWLWITDRANALYTTYFRRAGSRGDSSLIFGSDSSIYVRGVVDSAGFHHYVTADGSVVFYSVGGGVGNTDISIGAGVNADTVKSSTGASGVIAKASPTFGGIMDTASYNRLWATTFFKYDSTAAISGVRRHPLYSFKDTIFIAPVEVTNTNSLFDIIDNSTVHKISYDIAPHTFSITVDNMAAIDNRSANVNFTTFVKGFYSPGDGGGGEFYYVSGSSATVVPGMVISVTGGRLFRKYTPGYFNVLWFGVKGDGITNDAPSISTAVNYSSGTFIVPNPSVYYRLGNQVGLNKSNVTIVGQDMFLTKFVSDSSGVKANFFIGYNTHDITMQDMNIVNNDTATVANQTGAAIRIQMDTAFDGVSTRVTHHINFIRLRVSGYKGRTAGIIMIARRSGYGGTIRDILIDNCLADSCGVSGFAILGEGGTTTKDWYYNIQVRNSRTKHTGIYDPASGFGIDIGGRGSNNVVEGNYVTDAVPIGIEMAGTTRSRLSHNRIDSCFRTSGNATNGWTFDNATAARGFDNTADHNTVIDSIGGSVLILNQSRFTSTGNVIKGYSSGSYIDSVYGSSFTGDKYVSYSGSGTYLIWLRHHSKNNVFTGCSLVGNPTQDELVLAQDTAFNNVFQNCIIDGEKDSSTIIFQNRGAYGNMALNCSRVSNGTVLYNVNLPNTATPAKAVVIDNNGATATGTYGGGSGGGDSTVYQTKFRSDTARDNTYAEIALKKNLNDSSANNPAAFTTQASRKKLSDSLQSVTNALLSLKKNLNDSSANNPAAFTTQASRKKLADSLGALIGTGGGGSTQGIDSVLIVGNKTTHALHSSDSIAMQLGLVRTAMKVGDSISAVGRKIIQVMGTSIEAGYHLPDPSLAWPIQYADIHGDSADISSTLVGGKLVPTMTGQIGTIQVYDSLKHSAIFFEYGLNDTTTRAFFKSEYMRIIDSAIGTHYKWPKNKVFIISAPYGGGSHRIDSIYSNASMEAAAAKGVRAIDLYTYTLTHGYIATLDPTDSLHPFLRGATKIVNCVLNAVRDTAGGFETNQLVVDKLATFRSQNIFKGQSTFNGRVFINDSIGNLLKLTSGLYVAGDANITEKRWIAYNGGPTNLFGVGVGNGGSGSYYLDLYGGQAGGGASLGTMTSGVYTGTAFANSTGLGVFNRSPSVALDVTGAAKVSGNTTLSGALVVVGDNNPLLKRIGLYSSGNEFFGLGVGNQPGIYRTLITSPSDQGGIDFGTVLSSNGTTYTSIASAANVSGVPRFGVNQTAPLYTLDVTGAARITALPNGAVGDSLVSDSSGVLRKVLADVSNSFTSTLTNNTNVSSVTFGSASYMRVGNRVWGTINATVTPSTGSLPTTINFTLPVTSSNGSQTYVGDGSAFQSGAAGSVGQCSVTSTTGGAFSFYALNNSAYTVVFHFLYSL